ncbi:MAG: DUF3440 domain-containing protein [Anaeroplasmataceae bacterium]|nr:DUF3440 domain-containing protein [Anaeroplasmataceae bacterium]
MKKRYLELNVYQMLQNRLKFIFEEFENIFVSFSGGKDSGLLLNLVLDYKRKYYPHRVIGVFHQDFEAQYDYTTKYVEKTFERIKNEAELYWVCLPMATRTALSNYEMYWYPWDDRCEDIWVRPMPKHEYVISLEKNPITTYKYKMHQEDLAKQFGRWYRTEHGETSTICLLGIRADESLHRYSGFLNKKKGYKHQCYITQQFKNVWCASPLYDWSVSDVWHAIALNGYDYNPLYDLFYQVGIKPSMMRVASPFNDYAKDSINYYRVIEPETWGKLLGRVQGVNFAGIYGRTKALGYRNVTLPEGHTWESYTKFLLATLPARIRNGYLKKFKTSIDFWHNVGGGLEEETIQELEEKGYAIQRNGVSNYTIFKNSRVVFLGKIPDHTDDIKTSRDIPSWKRMCYCILKNDHLCRSMGFGLTRDQQRNLDQIKQKYLALEEIE